MHAALRFVLSLWSPLALSMAMFSSKCIVNHKNQHDEGIESAEQRKQRCSLLVEALWGICVNLVNEVGTTWAIIKGMRGSLRDLYF